MMPQVICGRIFNPRPDGTAEYLSEGVLAANEAGIVTFLGSRRQFERLSHHRDTPMKQCSGVLIPPFLDMHTHIPQHPIRGRFTEGVPDENPDGRLLAGLNRNVFPQEARFSDPDYTAQVVAAFREDTLSQGVVGGAAYMTVHPVAADVALASLESSWSVGLVLMNQNCPDYLRTREATLENDAERLAGRYGRRLILTDRFAVAVNTPLRRHAGELAGRLGLRTQTHLNEQTGEKELVERVLYPGYASYTDVYARDGLLDHDAIAAHCIHASDDELRILRDRRVSIAHCPTSNTLLGSGIMPLDRVRQFDLAYALCTDVGASPTTSLIAEMAQFLKVHAGRSQHATPQEALYRTTLAPAQILGLDAEFGSFAVGKPLSFIELVSACKARDEPAVASQDPDTILAEALWDLPDLSSGATPASGARRGALDALAARDGLEGSALALLTADVMETVRRAETRVSRVVVRGKTLWQRPQT